MAFDQHASNLINLTVKTFNGDVTNVSPTDGVSLLDSWISFLHTNEQGSNSSIESGLTSLKAVIQEGGTIDATEIGGILSDLTSQTKQLSDAAETENKPELDSLVKALQSFSHLVDGSGGPAKTGGQAPMTSTVGGESTNSGVGISAMAEPGNDEEPGDDELTDRNGGTVDEDSTIDMDDTTGSDGGAPESNAPEKDNRSDAQTGDSSYSSGSTSSRSDTSRVGGPGISGGTGDTDTAQSGGRSQY